MRIVFTFFALAFSCEAMALNPKEWNWPHMLEPIDWIVHDHGVKGFAALDFSTRIDLLENHNVFRFRSNDDVRGELDAIVDQFFETTGPIKVMPPIAVIKDFYRFMDAAFTLIHGIEVKARPNGSIDTVDIARLAHLIYGTEIRMRNKQYARILLNNPLARALLFNFMTRLQTADPRIAKAILTPIYNSPDFWNREGRAYSRLELVRFAFRAVMLPGNEIWNTGRALPLELSIAIASDLNMILEKFKPSQSRNSATPILSFEDYQILESTMISLAVAKGKKYELSKEAMILERLKGIKALLPFISKEVLQMKKDAMQQEKQLGRRFGYNEPDTPSRFQAFLDNFPRMLQDLVPNLSGESMCRERISGASRRNR